MAGTITVGELLSDPTSGNKITIGSGTTLDLVNGAGSVTLPETASGKVLQVVSLNTGTYFNTSSTGFVVTPLTLAITPSSTSSSILISISMNGLGQGGVASAKSSIKLHKNGTGHTWMSDYWGYGIGLHSGSFSWERLDFPSTTSAITYAVHMTSDSGTNCDFNNWGGAAGRTTSTITLTEIGA